MKDRVVVITGASAGIGAALARAAAPSWAVVLVARRETELHEVAASCGPDTLVAVADVTKRSEVDRVRDQAIAKFGKIDAWVNNAGRGITKNASALTDDDIDEMITVNVKSAMYGMQTVLPHFKERAKGHIVNVSSMLGRIPFASFRSAYCGSKHMLNALTACLRMELQAIPGIMVSTVSPGIVATEFGSNSLHGGMDSKKLPGAQSAEEVAEVILDLMENPRADVYTRDGAREMVAGYYAAEDMAAAEAKFAIR